MPRECSVSSGLCSVWAQGTCAVVIFAGILLLLRRRAAAASPPIPAIPSPQLVGGTSGLPLGCAALGPDGVTGLARMLGAAGSNGTVHRAVTRIVTAEH